MDDFRFGVSNGVDGESQCLTVSTNTKTNTNANTIHEITQCMIIKCNLKSNIFIVQALELLFLLLALITAIFDSNHFIFFPVQYGYHVVSKIDYDI